MPTASIAIQKILVFSGAGTPVYPESAKDLCSDDLTSKCEVSPSLAAILAFKPLSLLPLPRLFLQALRFHLSLCLCVSVAAAKKKRRPVPSGGGFKSLKLVYLATLPASPCQNTRIDNTRNNSTRIRFSGRSPSCAKAYTRSLMVATRRPSR